MSDEDCRYKLISIILSKSNAECFEKAKYEWNVVGYDEEDDEMCVCGKQHIKYCYTIQHKDTNEILFPIGSECVKRFENENMEYEAEMLSHKYKVFKNKNKKHDGKTYDYICKTDPNYIKFIQQNGLKTKYLKLVGYYNFIQTLNI